jgi:hypothetical protein
VAAGEAEFLALARPLIRQPDLVRVLEAGGRVGRAHLLHTSCTICLMHDALRCWPRRGGARRSTRCTACSAASARTGSGTKPSAGP